MRIYVCYQSFALDGAKDGVAFSEPSVAFSKLRDAKRYCLLAGKMWRYTSLGLDPNEAKQWMARVSRDRKFFDNLLCRASHLEKIGAI
jgi:hypothetical protein